MRDVLIVGGGIAGLSLGLALRRSFGAALKIGIVDPAFGRRPHNSRASALTAGSRRVLDVLGVWRQIEDRAQPILKMKITDSRRNDAVRPDFLHFDLDLPQERGRFSHNEGVRDGAPRAHMILNSELVGVLEAEIAASAIEVLTAPAERIIAEPRKVTVRLADGTRVDTALLVGADGARSAVRDAVGLQTVGRDYGRSAIVATLGHDVAHEGLAVQHFLPAGPFAMLPLTGRRSSIVWTERAEDIETILALEPEDFLIEIERRFGHDLGAFTLLDKPVAYPLRLQLSRRFIAPRTALIGDAARVLHPLAGQGLNLAFRDLAALVECLAEPVRLGLDPGDATWLTEYQRARLFDSVAMAAATDGLHRLFSNDVGALRLLRDLGLGLVDRAPGLKRWLVGEAAGERPCVPSLLQGRFP